MPRPENHTAAAFVLAIALILPIAIKAHGQDAPARTPEELEVIQSEIEIRRQTEASLEAEAQLLSDEIERLRSQSIEAAAAIQENERERTRLAAELPVLEARLAEAQLALSQKRASLAPMLGVLQRLRRTPPPALLVSPEDATGAARAAMLLSGMTRHLLTQAQALKANFDDVNILITAIDDRRHALDAADADYVRTRAGIDRLVEAKHELQERATGDLATERARMDELAGRAENMQSLMAWLDEEQPSTPVDATATQAAGTPVVVAAGNGRLRTGFAAAKGRLTMPVNGQLIGRFGDPIPPAAQAMGIRLATPDTAQVVAPFDGEIVFAGEFGAYGQLLILSAGEGYFVLLAGFGRLDAVTGQWVLAGEPVGLMPAAGQNGAPGGLPGSLPGSLYVEIQQNRQPTDPLPWFADFAGANG